MPTVLALGETLVDLISAEVIDDLSLANGFRMYVGGQVTNLALNLARLGVDTVLSTCVGRDAFGRFARRQIEAAGLDEAAILSAPEAATSVSIIARQTGTPDFLIHRGADPLLRRSAILDAAISDCQILHTSAFALSRNPARSLILDCIHSVREKGALVTVDPNYHPRIWPDTSNFLEQFAEACRYVDVTKPSLDDCHRIFGPGLDEEQYASRFLAWGVDTVLITMGAQGVFLAQSDGQRYRIHPNQIQVADVTGAGDAFWAGFLSATLSGADPTEAARLGQVLAEHKIRTIGPITEFPPNRDLLQEAKLIRLEQLEAVRGGDDI